MTHIPVTGYLSNASRTDGEMKQAFEDLRDAVAEGVGQSTVTELTIATGAITPTQAEHYVDTEADAATDDLDICALTNVADGAWLLLRCVDSARNVVVKHGIGSSGQMLLVNAADLTLDDVTQYILLRLEGTSWVEVFREYGNQSAARQTFMALGGYAAKNPAVLPKATAYTVVAADDGRLIDVDASGAARTVTALLAATAGNGFTFGVRKTDSSVNLVTTDGSGAETINGTLTRILAREGQVEWYRCDGTGWWVDAVHLSGFPAGHLWGLRVSNNVTDAVNDLDIAVGEALSLDRTTDLVLPVAVTRQMDVAYGTGNGGLSSSLTKTASTTYHAFIFKDSAGIVDIGFDSSITAFNLVTNHSITTPRRLMSFYTTPGNAVVPFDQDGDEFLIEVITSYTNTPGSTAAFNITLDVPNGLQLRAIISGGFGDLNASTPGSAMYGLITSLFQPDVLPTSTKYSVAHSGHATAGDDDHDSFSAIVRTDALRRIRGRYSSVAAGVPVLVIITHGWIDNRGRSG